MRPEEATEVFDLLSNEEFIKWAKSPNKENQLFWEKWLDNNPDKKDAFYQAKRFILNVQFRTDAENGDAHKNGETTRDRFDRILKDVLNEHHSPRFESKPKSHRPFISYPVLVRLAAAIIFLATFVFLLQRNPKPAPSQEIAAIQQVTKQNPNGRKSTIILPDGTIVTLNSDSKIIYPEEFGTGYRKVELVGEAFFKVAHDPLHPFIVRAKNVETTALGTSFDVRAFEREGFVSVYLVEGKVRVDLPGLLAKKYVINPGEGLEYSENQQKANVSRFDADNVLWRNGILVFNRSSLANFIDVIERWYDVEVRVEGNARPDLKINGRFDNETLKVVLESLKFSTGINYGLHNKKVKLVLNQ